jgi:hypothetical protein
MQIFNTGASATRPNTVFVTQENVATTLGGTISSAVEYVITGIIDMTGFEIVVPATGVYLRGYNFDISQLVSAEAGATLFSSAASGNVLMLDIGIEMSGTGSQVYNLVSNTGFEAIEVQRINYNNCTSLGTLDNFRQGLETGTGRFGGTPNLILKGAWSGGFFIATSIARSLTAGSYALFEAGAGFVMQSRFRSDMNIDLPASASFVDFSVTNFPNASTLQFIGMIITRAGVSLPSDALLTPNIDRRATSCLWTGNNGLFNTYVGAVQTVSTQNATTIVTAGTSVELTNPVYTVSKLAHFDAPATGQLRHLGSSPREYRIVIDYTIEGPPDDEVRLEIWRYKDADTSNILKRSITRPINSLTGGRDVSFITTTAFIDLDINDKVYFKIANVTTTGNLTLELGSSVVLEAR